MNYGVRYSRDTGRSDSDLAPIPCSDAVKAWGAESPCVTGNLLDALVPGLGSRVRQPNEDFGPKAGFAYDIKGDGKTVIRGGMGLYFENNIFNNVLFDRPARLANGLFFSDAYLPSGTTSLSLPTGATLTTINGDSIAGLWTEPLSKSAPDFAALEAAYQAATKSAGPAANGSYVANSLSEGPNGLSLYAPNFRTARSIQINIGVQRQVWKGAVLSADYIRNVGLHFQQAIDENHVGDASTLNTKAATHAITQTIAACSTTSVTVSTIDQAIASCPGLHTDGSGATISDFAAPQTVNDSNGNPLYKLDGGLDSANTSLGGSPFAAANGSSYPQLTADTGAAFPGQNPLFGRMAFNFPLGRSVYNGLQLNLKQNARIPIPGIKQSSFEISYALSRFVSSGGSDQNFTPTVADYNNPLGYMGPAGTDRTHQFSYGGTFTWVGSVVTSFIGHYSSALPTTLTLDPAGNGPGEIFKTDVTGDGTVGDILPGYKSGAFMRSIKPRDLARVIANYNLTDAGRLTPAGQALVSAGLMTSAQMTELGAVTPTIAAPPVNNAGNGSLRTFDLTLSRPTKVKYLGPSGFIEPNVSFYNLFNFSNFGAFTNSTMNASGPGSLATQQAPGTVDGTDTSLSGRSSLRLGNGSGTFGQGVARVIEYGLKINF